MSAFNDSYVSTILWAESDGDEPLERKYGIDDFSPGAMERIQDDCDEFRALGAEAIASCGRSLETVAYDFWLTRNRHGAGFWDGDYPEPEATQLTDLAHSFGECCVYVGDDGKLCLS